MPPWKIPGTHGHPVWLCAMWPVAAVHIQTLQERFCTHRPPRTSPNTSLEGPGTSQPPQCFRGSTQKVLTFGADLPAVSSFWELRSRRRWKWAVMLHKRAVLLSVKSNSLVLLLKIMHKRCSKKYWLWSVPPFSSNSPLDRGIYNWYMAKEMEQGWNTATLYHLEVPQGPINKQWVFKI